MDNIIIATVKEWNLRNYFELKDKFKDEYRFYLISDQNELNAARVKEINPKLILFPHWSWIVAKDIYEVYECVVFHMTDLPFGRGGSPFQNLIFRGIYNTKVSALRVGSAIDAGDIYLKEDVNISIGSAEENFIQISQVVFTKMIPKLLKDNLIPLPQEGKVTMFQRRTPAESDISLLKKKTISSLYDFIRMLDAEGYPKAYLDLGKIKLEFSEVHPKNDKLVGRFEVKKNV